jgi:glycosyltransferase involved in cell wall biosynthesis
MESKDLTGLDMPEHPPIRFMSVGRLIHWKGFHLGIEAFAQAACQQSEYWIIGDGPERRRLEALVRSLGVADRVRFFGWLEKRILAGLMAQAHILVHPSFHDSGGAVCLEAMLSGHPVICFQLGGPATQISDECGIRIAVADADRVIADLSQAMRRLASGFRVIRAMGAAGRKRALAE